MTGAALPQYRRRARGLGSPNEQLHGPRCDDQGERVDGASLRLLLESVRGRRGGLGLLSATVLRLGESWWQQVPAALLGFLVTQFGFLGHDAAHRQIFASAAWNDWAGRILSGVFIGLSYAWRRGKHNRYHAAPNQEGRDPDIKPGELAFTREIAAGRTTGAQGWFLRRPTGATTRASSLARYRLRKGGRPTGRMLTVERGSR